MGAPVAISRINPLVQAGGALFLAAETAADFQKIKKHKNPPDFPLGVNWTKGGKKREQSPRAARRQPRCQIKFKGFLSGPVMAVWQPHPGLFIYGGQLDGQHD